VSHYSNNPHSCRVDFFKPSGKWYTTEAVQFSGEDYSQTKDIHTAFSNALTKSIGTKFKGMTAVCLEPFHANSHPISKIL
jgi:hypothetical protein